MLDCIRGRKKFGGGARGAEIVGATSLLDFAAEKERMATGWHF